MNTMNAFFVTSGEQPDEAIHSLPGASAGSPKREDSLWGAVGDTPLSRGVYG